MDPEDQEYIKPPQCPRCLFYNQYDEKGATCKAFPEGIPLKYLAGDPHNKTVKGQIGVYMFVPNLEEIDLETKGYYKRLCIETYPLTKEICKLVGVEKANLIRRYIIGWLGTRKLKQKLGKDISIDTSEHKIRDFRKSLERAQRRELKQHERCEICGENRISDKCHIWPSAYGGTSDEDNMIYLCPTHHFLFDQYRLSKEEWNKLDFSNRPEPIKDYIAKVHLKEQQEFWKHGIKQPEEPRKYFDDMLKTAIISAINGDSELLKELDFKLLKSKITEYKHRRFVDVDVELSDFRTGQKRKIKISKLHKAIFSQNDI